MIQYTYILSHHKMVDLIEENPALLLFLQHFNIEDQVGDQTIEELSATYAISETLFSTVANLYNGYYPQEKQNLSSEDILHLVAFLKNSHRYYRQEMYPQIQHYIHLLQEGNPEIEELSLLESFFQTYYKEVQEHLLYEDEVAFPYYKELLSPESQSKRSNYSSKEYHNHHSDIELKLTDLKNLLLKHISIKRSYAIRRRLLLAIFELSSDLYIHSRIEDTLLIPAGLRLERIQKEQKS